MAFSEFPVKKTLLSLSIAASLSVPTIASAVSVAILDTGSNNGHNRHPDSYDIANGDANPDDSSHNGHGTTISRIIQADAAGAQQLILKVVNDNDRTLLGAANGDAGLQRAIAANADVIEYTSELNVSLGALQQAANSGAVIVAAAGNQGAGEPLRRAQLIPQLNGAGLIVGAVRGNSIAIYSNRAGGYRDHYVVAPGATQFSSTQGTSFA
jgi:thermitase